MSIHLKKFRKKYSNFKQGLGEPRVHEQVKIYKILLDEALDNIRSDRKVAREFLNEIANQIATDAEQNKHLSPVAAKHIETMQRSNEQLS